MTKEYHILPIINRNDLIKANDHVWIYLSLFITDDMMHDHREIMLGLNLSQQVFLTFYLLDGIMRNDSSPYSGFSNFFNNIFGGNTNRGFLQFIYDGYGEFVFEKPFSETIETWGAKRIGEIIEKAKIIYENHKEKFYKAKILKKYSYLHSEIPDFEKLDNEYMLIINEEAEIIKKYITNNINDFAMIDEDNTQINYIDKEIIEINRKKEKMQKDSNFINLIFEDGTFPKIKEN